MSRKETTKDALLGTSVLFLLGGLALIGLYFASKIDTRLAFSGSGIAAMVGVILLAAGLSALMTIVLSDLPTRNGRRWN